MARRIPPSVAVALIDEAFNWAATGGPVPNINGKQAADIMTVVSLADLVPDDLLMLDQTSYARYVRSVETLRYWLAKWQRDWREVESGMPIRAIRAFLARCPDDYPPASVTELKFVTDAALRASLRSDIASIDRHIVHGDWKSATVLAGSVIESLLLWRLSQESMAQRQAAFVTLGASMKKGLDIQTLDDKKWSLASYAALAAAMKLISETTTAAIDLARDFRNLIHPAAAQRLGQECNRGTAYSAVAALDHVVTDLS